MSTTDQAFELKKKAIQIAKDRNVFSSIEWIINQREFGVAPSITVTTDKTKDDFEDCNLYFSFTFQVHQYQVFLEKEHSFYTPDGYLRWGEVRLLVDAVEVYKDSYEVVRDEYGGSSKSLILIDSTILALKLDDWIENFPSAVEIEKDTLAQIENKKNERKRKDEAVNIAEQFSLGKFSVSDTSIESKEIDDSQAIYEEKQEEAIESSKIDLYDENGYTPLMAAVKKADLPLVKILISMGANPNLLDATHQTSTALDMAKLLCIRTSSDVYVSMIELLEPITDQ